MVVSDHTRDRVLVEELTDVIPDLVHVGHCFFRNTNVPLHTHVHPGIMEFTYLEYGRLHYEIGTGVSEINAGEVIATYPDEWHGHSASPMARMKFCWLGVRIDPDAPTFLGSTDPEILDLRRALCRLPRRHFPGDEQLSVMVHRFCDALFSRPPFRVTRMRNAVIEFLVRAVDLAAVGLSARISRRVQQSMELIERRLGENPTLAEIAAAAGVGLTTFKRLFKEQVGVAPHDHMLRRKVDRGKNLLATTGRSVTDIGLELGFSSGQHFASTFRRIALMSPSDFRRRAGVASPGAPLDNPGTMCLHRLRGLR